mmetsp:Transcript_14517/g.40891  ORF Transcript_14517/g.40891 Transcript_14517/m.40891 type:complete len:231 (-) Transcript_14517:1281-1973(-)
MAVVQAVLGAFWLCLLSRHHGFALMASGSSCRCGLVHCVAEGAKQPRGTHSHLQHSLLVALHLILGRVAAARLRRCQECTRPLRGGGRALLAALGSAFPGKLAVPLQHLHQPAHDCAPHRDGRPCCAACCRHVSQGACGMGHRPQFLLGDGTCHMLSAAGGRRAICARDWLAGAAEPCTGSSALDAGRFGGRAALSFQAVHQGLRDLRRVCKCLAELLVHHQLLCRPSHV